MTDKTEARKNLKARTAAQTRKINTLYNKCEELVVSINNNYIELINTLFELKTYLKWGEFEKKIDSLDLDPSMRSKVRKTLKSDFVEENINSLPQHISTLYMISQNEEKCFEHFENGVLNSSTTRKELEMMVKDSANDDSGGDSGGNNGSETEPCLTSDHVHLFNKTKITKVTFQTVVDELNDAIKIIVEDTNREYQDVCVVKTSTMTVEVEEVA